MDKGDLGGADPALALRAEPASRLSASRIDQGDDDGEYDDPAAIIADLLSSALMPPDGTWASARYAYCWERAGLDYLVERKAQGDRPPINAWTAWIADEGYPPQKAGELHGKFWVPLWIPPQADTHPKGQDGETGLVHG